ncbi:hypothetical protein QWZ03_03775 [Chitinimonas viridis]|uniref:Glycosyltransferase RgtA/B/C/D-like domain-containing protein n=1 Tax=Chitinimonas viridis TaxID=664880 RepID=A0ABT8B239_9NEIS|nr:hypothetical protein [Chitinimonas viridis]MDN3575890.1 hypothetical protein [Chitinimonas viridis]
MNTPIEPSLATSGRTAHWQLRDSHALLLLLIIAVTHFYSLLFGGWRGDDPAILWHAMNSSGLSAFHDPADWQKLSPNNLTPWITLSFKLDLWLAGPDPLFFYQHQLLSLCLAATAAYALGRCWLPPAWSLAFACLFLAGAPTTAVVEALMTRHYLEGLLFAILAVIAFVLAQRRQHSGWVALGALAYALAATAKEIFVPLPLVLLAMPPFGRIAERARLLAPYFCVALAYVIWRQYMLGGVTGGYAAGQALDLPALLTQTIQTFAGFPRLILGPYWPLPTIILGAALTFYLSKRPAGLPLALMLGLCLLGPLVPLVFFPGIHSPDRYLFLVWFAVSLASILSVRFAVSYLPGGKVVQRGGAALVFLMTIVPLIGQDRAVSAVRQTYYQEYDVQGKFMLEAGAEQAWIPSPTLTSTYWFVTQLCEIKRSTGLSCPTVLFKGVPAAVPVRQLYRYDPQQKQMVDISARLEAEIAQTMAVDETRPLTARVSIENGHAAWQFGPYEEGQYFIASASLGRYPVSRVGSIKTALTAVPLHLQYESPEGWTTRSPLLWVRPGQPIDWARR